jgi:hypothetical protein
MVFRCSGKEYRGRSALEVVDMLKQETHGLEVRMTARQFMLYSFAELRHQIPLRQVDTTGRMDVETFALSYLYLRDEYGLGELLEVPNRNRWARPLNLA